MYLTISSALYFAKGQAIPFTENVVTIDIGGGTSDLSIWQTNKLLWRNSFRLAGKDVLINYLTNNLTLIKAEKEKRGAKKTKNHGNESLKY